MAESKKFLLFVLTIVWTTSITESTLSGLNVNLEPSSLHLESDQKLSWLNTWL